MLERRVAPRSTSIITTLAMLILLPLFLAGMYQAFNILTQALGVPANIVVHADVKLETISTQFLHAFAQGGEEAQDMIKPVIPEVKALRPALIRIDHLYDYYNIVSRSGNSLSFDFSKLDGYIDSIIATGAKPVLALSYMPPAIAKGGSVINPPDNWNDWALVVQKTIEHYSGKGSRNMSGVYYEVWNEPDLAQFGGWKIGGDKNYLTLYQYAAIGAKQAQNVNQFFLGGPASTGLYKNWVLGLAQSGYRIDFWSWHSYIADPKRYAQDQKNLAEWLAPSPSLIFLPKLITEFGFTGAKSTLYNTMYAAAHTAAVFRQIASGGPTYLFSFQLKDGPNQTDGWGLLSHEAAGKKPKPRYSVYALLDTMQGTKLQLSGEGSWTTALATTQNNVIRLLLVNFNFQNSKAENVPVTFTGLTPGTYTYREHFLLGRDVNFPNITSSDGTLSRQVYMPADSVAVLEVTKTQ